jgi:long-subunit acyl-CoA synthetase (AMP-forming)
MPKGICKSHSQIITQIYPGWNLKSCQQEVLLVFSTLYWLSGVIFLICGTLYGGKRVVTTKNFDPDLMIDLINRFKVTTTLLPPSGISSLLHSNNMKPLESLEVLLAGGSVVSKSLCASMKLFLPNGEIYTVYGMTESDFSTGSFNFQRYGSVGKPSPNVQLKIIDEAGENLGPNEQGEVCFKTAVTFLGYFEDPENTKDTVINGWVHSGDIGYFDDDEFLFIVDRKKELLKYNNFQVSSLTVQIDMKTF